MLYFRFCTLCDSKRNSLRLQTQSASKRKWSVLTCTKKYTVSALTRFSWRSVSALTGFSRKKKRRARSACICAVAQCGILKKSFTSFRSFSKFRIAKENGRQKNELLQIAKITFPSSVFRHCIFGRSNKNTVTDFLLPKIFFLTFQKQAPRYSFQQSGIGLQNREVR